MPTWEEPSLWSVRDKSEMLSERRFAIAARMADFASNPSIDVVIPVRNHWELTRRCLELLKSQSASHSVVVVDNGSDDGTPAKIEASFPEVQVIELGANTGFSHACNRGVESGRSEIVVLLNNDVEPRVAFLEHLVAPFRDGNVGSVAALLLQPGEETIDSVGLCADPTLAGFPRLRGWPVGEAVSSAPVLSGPSGGGGAYRRLAWEEVGGLDEGVRCPRRRHRARASPGCGGLEHDGGPNCGGRPSWIGDRRTPLGLAAFPRWLRARILRASVRLAYESRRAENSCHGVDCHRRRRVALAGPECGARSACRVACCARRSATDHAARDRLRPINRAGQKPASAASGVRLLRLVRVTLP